MALKSTLRRPSGATNIKPLGVVQMELGASGPVATFKAFLASVLPVASPVIW